MNLFVARQRHSPGKARHSQCGVTLVELIIVIAIAGIVASVVALFIVRPIQGYEAQSRRADLVDRAESALRRMQRDVRAALPNSVRIPGGTGLAMEMLNTLDGARYRDEPGQVPAGHDHSPTQFVLSFTAPDTDGFNILGFFQNVGVVANSGSWRLAINNQGIPSADAYADAVVAAGARVITNPDAPANEVFQIQNDAAGDEHQIVPLGGASFQFKWPSPTQRIFVVDTPVSYICDLGAGTLTRYVTYNIVATQPTDPAVAPLNAAAAGLIADGVTGCQFTYQPGSAQRAGLVTLDLTVQDVGTGEQVRLLHQVHVDNAS